MKKFLLGLGFLLGLALPAAAQQCVVTTAAPSYTTGTSRAISCNTAGGLRTENNNTSGDVAHDAVDSGNPVKIGGFASGSVPGVVASGDRVNAFFTVSGALITGTETTATAGTDDNTQASLMSLGTAASDNAWGVAGYNFDGTNWDRIRGDITGGLWMQGAIANDAVDTGNPVKIGGLANTSFPSAVANADRVSGWFGLNGQTMAGIVGGVGTAGADDANQSSLISSTTALVQPIGAGGYAFDGTNWDRLRTVGNAGAVTGIVGLLAVSDVPSTSTNTSIVPVVSTAVETGRVLKASAGNLYSVSVTSGAAAGRVLVHNTTTVPVAGAVTPVDCIIVAANATVKLNYDPPLRLSTGISVSFSTATTCFTQTDSATAFISGLAL